MEISEYDMHANISKNEPRTMYPLVINRKFCTRHVTGREFSNGDLVVLDHSH
jgi:hypothetical protein